MTRSRSGFARVQGWLPEAFFVVVTTAAGLWAGGRWLDPVGDPGFGWSLAYRLAHGELLYRDVYLTYGPLSPYLMAAWGSAFGLSSLSVLLLNWIAAIAAGVLLLRCGRPLLSMLERFTLAGVILAFSLFVPGAGRLVLPYYPGVVHALALSLGALLTVQGARGQDSRRQLFAGFLAGLAFCAKQEIGLAAALALFASLLPRRRAAFPAGARILAGLALAVLFGASVAFSSVSLDTLRNQNHLWPLDLTPPSGLNRLFLLAAGMSSPNWAFGLKEAAWGLLVLLVLLAAFGLLAARESRLARWLPIALLAPALLVWWIVEAFRLPSRPPVALSTLVAATVTLLALFKRDLKGRSHVIAMGALATLANLRAVFSPTVSGHFDGPAHLISGLTWVLFLCVLAPPLLARGEKPAAWMRGAVGVLLLVVSWEAALSGAQNLRFPWKQRVATPRGSVFMDSRNAHFFRALARELKPGERVLVIPEINAVDALFAGQNASLLLDHLPGWLDPKLEREIVARLDRDPPDAVVLFHRALHEYGVRAFGDGYGEILAEWISRNYAPVVSERAGVVLRSRFPRNRPPRSLAPGPTP